MTCERVPAALIGGSALLERAIGYTLGSLQLVTRQAMSQPTPCRGWDLRALLGHMNDSLLALTEAIDLGRVDVDLPVGGGNQAVDFAFDQADPVDGNPIVGLPVAGGLTVGLVASLRDQACQLLGGLAATRCGRPIAVAGYELTRSIVTSTGAIEVAVHGWDVARACGRDRPIPPSLAEELLELCPLFVSDADRPNRFAAPADVPPLAGPGDRLLAFLGRHPGAPAA
jgi:uncharacterized protein (TIGR03083 family)